MLWWEWLAVGFCIMSVTYFLIATFIIIPLQEELCATKNETLARCDGHCGCAFYGCVNTTEQERNDMVREGCLLI